ncbi:MAG: hypothetical protein M3Q99_05955 [Acidobacteriota bacterium]|nr:hypothetical protein [Acidobacteriota bacterium]
MKKRFLIALSAMLVFGLAVVAFAFTNAKHNTKQTSAVSCPMMEKHHSATAETGKEKHSCGMADCCKDGKCSMGGACCKDKDSCPMKNAESKENQTAADDYSKIIVSDESGADCCAAGASCCKDGAACCKGKHG